VILKKEDAIQGRGGEGRATEVEGSHNPICRDAERKKREEIEDRWGVPFGEKGKKRDV